MFTRSNKPACAEVTAELRKASIYSSNAVLGSIPSSSVLHCYSSIQFIPSLHHCQWFTGWARSVISYKITTLLWTVRPCWSLLSLMLTDMRSHIGICDHLNREALLSWLWELSNSLPPNTPITMVVSFVRNEFIFNNWGKNVRISLSVRMKELLLIRYVMLLMKLHLIPYFHSQDSSPISSICHWPITFFWAR